MSKKVFNLCTGILGGVSAIASAVVTFCQPANAVVIVAAIGIANTAIVEILTLFTKSE